MRSASSGGEGGAGRALLHAIGGGILGGVNGWEGAIKGALGGATTTLMALPSSNSSRAC
ncbi:hypothetical protein [Rhizobium rhizogenes]|uniref:hypothetical protein n=1 Tax=Rhizobium rhizogenes TaxID=359 RepID=UPI001F2FD5BA|nr:hypothetical protein [Rhizobium rhizogenes]